MDVLRSLIFQILACENYNIIVFLNFHKLCISTNKFNCNIIKNVP